jgi:hypothetical protein
MVEAGVLHVTTDDGSAIRAARHGSEVSVHSRDDPRSLESPAVFSRAASFAVSEVN